MRKKVLILVIFIAIFFLFIKHDTPYSGKYYAGSTNEELVLKSNNSFTICFSHYKDSTTISGKYNITNNHIDLKPNGKNPLLYNFHLTSGEITGSEIKFSKSNYGSSIVFKKS